MPRWLLLALPALLFTGCATLTSDRTEPLFINSAPQGADIRIDGSVVGRTPGSVAIDKQRPQRVEVGFPGQPGATCPVVMSASMGYVVSDTLLCLFLFPFGCVSFIDAGGMWNTLQTPTCSVSLAAPGAVPGQEYPPSQYPPEQAPPPQYPPQQANPPPPPQGYPPPPPQGYPPPPPGQ